MKIFKNTGFTLIIEDLSEQANISNTDSKNHQDDGIRQN